jgi:parallel beta-helix repeat protein
MNQKLVVIISLLCLSLSTLPIQVMTGVTEASDGYPVHNLDTSLNYTTIQEAINANETQDGHTIFVENGVYFENVRVNKSISLIGESRESTVINGSDFGTVVTVKANHTAIKNFMICNSGTDLGDVGIYLGLIQDVNIEKNVIADTGGIYAVSSNDTAFTENVLNYNWYGIHLLDSSNNNITSNVLENNHYGITIDECSDHILSNNSMKNNVYNFGIFGETLPDFTHSIDTTNIINDRSVCYVLNEKNAVIDPSTFPNLGYIGIVNSTNIKINDWNLSNNFCTFLLAFVNGSTITNVNITDNFHGMYLFASNNNTIQNSRFAGNGYGLEQRASNNNTVIGNKFTENTDSLYLLVSNGNTVVENTIENSTFRGIVLSSSRNNMIYHNNFINNTNQASSSNSVPNDWDDGLEGNYWSEYNGTDANHDGIGDTPYAIDANNTDNYPLMGIFSDFNASSDQHVTTISNSSISNFQFNGTAIIFNVTGVEGTIGFCRICIPTALLNTPYRVLLNGTEIPCTLLPCSNETYSYLYFNYTHSTQEVIIIPEFQSFLIPMLLMIATLPAGIAYRRKHH